MKKIISLLLAICFIFAFGVSVLADEPSETSISAPGESLSENESDETSEMAVFEGPEGEKYAWLYVVIGVVAVLGVIAAAVAISKKSE